MLDLIHNVIYQQLLKSAGKLLTTTQSILFYTNFFKTELPCFSFCNELTCLTSFLWTPTMLAFTCFQLISLILLVLTVELSASTIFYSNLGKDFYLIEKLECLSSLLSTCPKSYDNCGTLMFCSIYNYMIEALCFNGSNFVWTILAMILSILLSKILSKLSLYISQIGLIWL